MNNLVKIRDVSLTYNVSVRTLRYYEELGLIESIRESDTTSRSYESKEICKLEKILLLRKMNISIKDIKSIFTSNQIDTLFNILKRKENDIDEDVKNKFLFIEEKITNNLYNALINNDCKLDNLKERIHLSMELIQSYAHERVFDNHPYINYDKMHDLIIITIKSIFE